jgi:hypothetical protein
MKLELTADEALVLFDLLSEYERGDADRTLTVRSPAERNVLWYLLSYLERELVAPFQPDYSGQLERARARLEEKGGGW